MNSETHFEALGDLIDRFQVRAREELELRWRNWGRDLSKKDLHEVVGALLARQVTLADQLAGCPAIWNGHVAPIFLRAMADVHITLVWILSAPEERPKRFIHYGLGQEKLQLEHRKANMSGRESYEGEKEYLDAVEEWINRQRLTFLTDVNVGSWSGVSTRKMSEESDCLDFYNYVYMPFSACAHSMWHHVARYNLKQCRNPLHRYHAVPDVPDSPIDVQYLYLAAKYLRKTFASFDEAMGIVLDGQTSFEILCEGLDALAEARSEHKAHTSDEETVDNSA